MILSQIPAPGAAEIAAFLGCLFFLVAGWNQVERFLDRRAGRHPPGVAPPSPGSAATWRTARQAEIAGLRHHVSKIDREVGELRASLELAHQQLARIDAKLDRVIERQLP